jgi:UDP-2,4-diacetamido-2,4,6-trideoxy-beta-L-altropyranose hydrolase
VIPIFGDHDVDVRAAKTARNWLSAAAGPSWLVVDHYQLDERWERAAAAPDTSVFVIDDLADRRHACRLLLDQNLSADAARRYATRVPVGSRLLLGPQYALLRPEFADARKRVRVRSGPVKRVLVFFGGSDPANLTTRTLDAIARMPLREVWFDVVVGDGNPRCEAIRVAASSLSNVKFHAQTTEMAALMAAADLSVGAGGTATWERCCLGLPAFVAVTADNQRRVVAESEAAGVSVNLGDASQLSASAIAGALDDALRGRFDLSAMSASALAVTDGSGARRVASILLAS